MNWDYQLTPYGWPMLASAVFMAALTAYTWRHRTAPGAVQLAAGMIVVGLWGLLAAVVAFSADPSTKLFWFRVKNVANNPTSLCALLFALEYAGLGAWVTRRNVAILLAPFVAVIPMMFLDDSRMLWTGYWVGETVNRTLAPMGVAINLYVLALLLLATAVIASLLVRSPLHRAPAALIILGNLGIAVVAPLEVFGVVGDVPFDVSVLGLDFTFAMYAVALSRFRLFDVVPVARETVLERMMDGMLVLDARKRIVDLNPAAQEILGAPRSRLLGQDGAQALDAFPQLVGLALDPGPVQVEVQLGTPAAQRWYQVGCSPLSDRRGFLLGRLVVFRDVTEARRTQEQLMEQQRALAVLEERDRVARELHDGLGQVLGFVKMQAQAASGLLASDQQTAQSYLTQLAAVAQDAHADIREYILGARTLEGGSGFLASLGQYLERFSATYGLRVELAVPPELSEETFGPAARVQLLRIIQEALTNARKHARAQQVWVKFALEGEVAEVEVADDGQGFEPGQMGGDGQKYGLRFMRERAAQVGGSLEVHSAPGQSTRVVVRVPVTTYRQ